MEWKALFASDTISPDAWRKATSIVIKTNEWWHLHAWIWKNTAAPRMYQKVLLQLIYHQTMSILNRKGPVS